MATLHLNSCHRRPRTTLHRKVSIGHRSCRANQASDWRGAAEHRLSNDSLHHGGRTLGPSPVNGPKRDEYKRITTGNLVEAELVFLDEIFKAGDAILPPLLMIVNFVLKAY